MTSVADRDPELKIIEITFDSSNGGQDLRRLWTQLSRIISLSGFYALDQSVARSWSLIMKVLGPDVLRSFCSALRSPLHNKDILTPRGGKWLIYCQALSPTWNWWSGWHVGLFGHLKEILPVKDIWQQFKGKKKVFSLYLLKLYFDRY